MLRYFSRRELLRATGALCLPLLRNQGRAQSAGAPWSAAAARKLKDEQEAAYTRLAQQLGLGNDPMAGYRYLVREPIPEDVLSAERYRKQFEPILGKGDNAKLDETFATYRKYLNAQPPTPYEDPNLYAMLREMTDRIQECIRSRQDALKSSQAAIPRVVLGSMPTGQVNAVTEAVPGTSEHLVIFNWGLFHYANHMSTLAGRSYPPLRPVGDHLAFLAEPDPVAYARTEWAVPFMFNAILRAYVVIGNPRSAPSFKLPDNYFPVAGLLLRSMELFMLAHEHAHILLRHTEKKQHEPQDEYDADWLGMQIMTIVMSEYPLRYTYWGADFMLSCCDVLERCVFALRNGSAADPPASSTHPPTPKRREQLRAVLRKISPGPEAEEAIRLAAQLQAFTDTIWRSSIGDWIEMHNKGVRPAATWGRLPA